MDRNFEIIEDYGKLSEDGNKYFRFINWNGYKRYDIREWGKNGKEPYKGVPVEEKDLENLLSLLERAVVFSNKIDSYVALKTISTDSGDVKICADFGSFGKVYGGMKKHVAYVDWGYGYKYDIRAWEDDFSNPYRARQHVRLTKEECEHLIELLCDVLEVTGEPEERDILFGDFLVRANRFYCNKNHKLQDIQARVYVLHEDGRITKEIVPAGYCHHCNVYYILERDYASLRANGVLLCRQFTEKTYLYGLETDFDQMRLSPKSKLNLIGYNVNSNDKLSTAQRQMLLVLAVESRIYTVSGICSFLDWLISRGERTSSRDMSEAIRKWEADRAFISQYKIQTLPSVEMNSIKKRGD